MSDLRPVIVDPPPVPCTYADLPCGAVFSVARFWPLFVKVGAQDRALPVGAKPGSTSSSWRGAPIKFKPDDVVEAYYGELCVEVTT